MNFFPQVTSNKHKDFYPLNQPQPGQDPAGLPQRHQTETRSQLQHNQIKKIPAWNRPGSTHPFLRHQPLARSALPREHPAPQQPRLLLTFRPRLQPEH